MTEKVEENNQSDPPRRVFKVLALSFACLATLLGSLIITIRSEILDVDKIEIRGLTRLTFNEIANSLEFEINSRLVGLKISESEKALTKLPWVEIAHVDRSWSGLVVVKVRERRPIALALSAPSKWVLVDRNGGVLTGPLANPSSYPRLSGVRAASEPGTFLEEDSGALLAILEAVPQELYENVEAIYRDGRSDIWIRLRTGENIAMGDDSRLGAKVASLATMVLEVREGELRGAFIDVSVPDLPIVRPRS
ncbi:MAG: cell division protein FtsQ/DivIB [Actinomycetota bacterium]|nr:FtsQ-type POTRA domain-containing protein [Acidimicrobiales bacterium]